MFKVLVICRQKGGPLIYDPLVIDLKRNFKNYTSTLNAQSGTCSCC